MKKVVVRPTCFYNISLETLFIFIITPKHHTFKMIQVIYSEKKSEYTILSVAVKLSWSKFGVVLIFC